MLLFANHIHNSCWSAPNVWHSLSFWRSQFATLSLVRSASSRRYRARARATTREEEKRARLLCCRLYSCLLVVHFTRWNGVKNTDRACPCTHSDGKSSQFVQGEWYTAVRVYIYIYCCCCCTPSCLYAVQIWIACHAVLGPYTQPLVSCYGFLSA